jgi:hypothetical protein
MMEPRSSIKRLSDSGRKLFGARHAKDKAILGQSQVPPKAEGRAPRPRLAYAIKA